MMPVAVKVSIKWLKSLWTTHPETPIHNIYQAKDRQLLARVPFSMQLLKMEQSYETSYIN